MNNKIFHLKRREKDSLWPLWQLIAVMLMLLLPVSGMAQRPQVDPADGQESPDVSSIEENTPEMKAQELFEKGRTAFYKQDYSSAARFFQSAMEIDASKAVYQIYLAKAYEYNGQEEKAMQQLITVMENHPENVEAGLALARFYYEQEKWEEIVNALQDLLQYSHDYPLYHYLGEAHYYQEQYSESQYYFKQAVALNPDAEDDYYKLGNIYLQDGKFALAAEMYNKSMSLGMDEAIIHYKLGTAYFNLRNYLGKIERKEFLGCEPGMIKDNYYLIDQVPNTDNTFQVAPPSSAIFQLQSTIDKGIHTPEILFLKANILLYAQKYALALALYAELEGKELGDLSLYYYYRAQANLGLRDFDNYLIFLEKAIKENPDVFESTRLEAYLQAANYYHQQGAEETYIDYLEKAIAENPNNPAIHKMLGNAYYEAGDKESAIVQWRMVLDLQNDHPNRMELLNLIKKVTKELEDSTQ